ncbi:histidine kinase N-terminal domain-containing protein [Neobacillus sp. LXY-1]|uniref:histidine kinase N-terminal domain-containing protein n=1 Tax=Neobacillus sp. LXY-1 TaxID=3379133 RepID=UPI003EE0C334
MESTDQMDHVYQQLSQFLKMHHKEFIDLWEEQIIVHNDKDDIDLIRHNGFIMYEFISKSFVKQLSDDQIQSLAYKIAKQRVDAEINIGEFVYNVNLGRSLIVKCVNLSGIEIEKLQLIIDLINRQFDLFCYHAVSRYTELKDKKLQEQNLYISQTHKDRLAILGQMSSCFVHEFRNPLTSVMGFIKLLKDDYPKLPYLDIVSKELEELKFRITQFLHTSRMNTVNESKMGEITIKFILEEVLDFLYPSIIDGKIKVNTKIDPKIKIIGDQNELKQVFLNLLMNAVDAVREDEKQRKIDINTEVDSEHIKIVISNNGPTINADEVAYIFEPFYTTKKLGTGIGLFVCKNIIEKHNGKIHCLSNNDLTTFEITLPINKSVCEEMASPTK